MKTITKVMTMVVFSVGLAGIQNTLAQNDYNVKTVRTIGGRVLFIEKPHRQTDEATGLIYCYRLGRKQSRYGWARLYMDNETPRIQPNDTVR